MPERTMPDSPTSSNVSEPGLVAEAVTLGAPESRVLVIATGMCGLVRRILSFWGRRGYAASE